MDLKQQVGQAIAAQVKNNEIIGVGTGSTVDAAIKAIALRVKEENLKVSIVPTSMQTAWSCEKIGLTVLSPTYQGQLAFGFDGADAVDKKCRAIKGKGAALLEEKILAKKCTRYVIVVDESKVVDDICAFCAVPVEVIPSALGSVLEDLKKLKPESVILRECTGGKHGPVITEHGNIIVDAQFSSMCDGLEQELKKIVGVVETGLFEKYAQEVLVAGQKGIYTIS